MNWEAYLDELHRDALASEAVERAEENDWWESLYDTMRPGDDP